MGLFTSGLGAHLTWTLPFGLLIMFAVFNRFDPALRGGRARPRRDAVAELPPRGAADHRALAWSASACSASRCHWDEIARSSQAIGDLNTLPLELQGLTTTVTTPAIYALGTVTTGVSLLVIAIALGQRRLAAREPRRAQPRRAAAAT